jgi:hypothetical protein
MATWLTGGSDCVTLVYMTTTDTTETTRRHMEATVAHATEQLKRYDHSSFSREHFEIQAKRAKAWLQRNPA